MRSGPRTRLLATVVVTIGACTCGYGCGSSASSVSVSSTRTGARSGGTTVRAGATAHVVMQSLYFNPVLVQAQVGARVVWTNQDAAPHNVTYISGPRFRSSQPMLSRGQQFAIRLAQPGTIHYYCTLHPWMKATIVVSQ